MPIGLSVIIIMIPLLLAAGLFVKPRPFPTVHQPARSATVVPLPADLPAPVARFYETIVGDEAPLLETAVISARGTVRVARITMPARMRFTHEAGQAYRHDIEATWYGYPVLKVHERYVDGQARLALPMGVVENEPKINMAANLGLWGESIWLPSIFVTDPRVRWQAVDDTTALLIVPFEDAEDTFTVDFDPATGLIQHIEAMRYRDAADTEKILWQLDILAWDEFQGILIPSHSSATWADEGTPWLVVELEDVVYNVDVYDAIHADVAN